MIRRAFIAALGSAAIAVPLAARAQQKAMPVVGVLSGDRRYLEFFKGLNEVGFVEGQTVAIEHHLAPGDYKQLPSMAADLVDRKVDLIVAFGAPAAYAAKAATSTIPIVFISGDPIAEGLVGSLGRPGSQLTGISLMTIELMPKRFELLSELVPQAKTFALLVDPTTSNAEDMVRHGQEIASATGIELHALKADQSDFDEIDAAFDTPLRLRVGALIVGADPLLIRRLPYYVASASRTAVPAIYVSSDFGWAGGLLSYGPVLKTALYQFGSYAGRILKGEKPADLPVLVVNLKTAKALGLTVPQSILARADEVIE